MPGLIPADELVAMRATAESSLDTLAYIWRATTTDDGAGHDSGALALTTQPKDVYVRVTEPKGALYGVLVAQLGTVEVVYISFSLDMDVRHRDEFRLSTGERFVVHQVGEPQSYATLNAAVCARVR